jgi:hypothetical protein
MNNDIICSAGFQPAGSRSFPAPCSKPRRFQTGSQSGTTATRRGLQVRPALAALTATETFSNPRRIISKTRRTFLPLLGGETSPKNSRIAPMNQSATFLPRRGNHFSLSPGERAGVRVSVKPIIPRASTRSAARYYPHLAQRIQGEDGRFTNFEANTGYRCVDNSTAVQRSHQPEASHE